MMEDARTPRFPNMELNWERLGDDDMLPLKESKYKGLRMGEVPADYLLYLLEKGYGTAAVREYVVRNKGVLRERVRVWKEEGRYRVYVQLEGLVHEVCYDVPGGLDMDVVRALLGAMELEDKGTFNVGDGVWRRVLRVRVWR